MAEHLRLAKTDDPPPREMRAPGGFTETETAQDILRSLSLVRELGGATMTMIAGAPGAGKTQAVRHFADKHGHDCIYLSAVCGEGTPWNFAHSLSRHWGAGAPDFGTVEEARVRFAACIGRDCLLIVDEAQYLHQKNRRTGKTGEALEWLRGMAETGGFPLVLCGDLTLVQAVAAMPQLQSRMRRPVILDGVKAADVEAIARAHGLAEPDALRALTAVARQRGGLRNVENVLRLAGLFAGGDAPGLSHLKAAILDMKLAPKGGWG